MTPEILHAKGLVPKKANVIKLLGNGEIKTSLKISVHKVSGSAKEKVEAAGGSVTILETKKAPEGGDAPAEG